MSLPGLAVALLIASTLLTAPASTSGRLSSLASRLWSEPLAVTRTDDGRPMEIFGIPAAEARSVLLPVSRERAAPPGYVPHDLVWSLARPVRAIIIGDLNAMLEAASGDGVDIVIVSGYRSPADQVAAFEATTRRVLARSGGSMTREEAEAQVSRVVAPPGHSQHQLGTAVDVSTGDIGYVLQPMFAETDAGHWVAEHAWKYGFVLPYSREGESRTGYAYEPWHLRWVGRQLSGILQADGYLDDTSVVADDYLRAVEELMDWERMP
jgi:hypothetical protein